MADRFPDAAPTRTITANGAAATLGILDRAQILPALPHPSGANAERISYFLGRKARAALSSKTLPGPIDEARENLRGRISTAAAAWRF
jgi:hypothetical protein